MKLSLNKVKKNCRKQFKVSRHIKSNLCKHIINKAEIENILLVILLICRRKISIIVFISKLLTDRIKF